MGRLNIYALRSLVPFAQFKKREKHPWRRRRRPATLLKLTLLHGCFSRFLSCTNATKSFLRILKLYKSFLKWSCSTL